MKDKCVCITARGTQLQLFIRRQIKQLVFIILHSRPSPLFLVFIECIFTDGTESDDVPINFTFPRIRMTWIKCPPQIQHHRQTSIRRCSSNACCPQPSHLRSAEETHKPIKCPENGQCEVQIPIGRTKSIFTE